VLVDYQTGAELTPLALVASSSGSDDTSSSAGHFEVRDSLLSEYAALGFEYGYSVEDRDGLVLWEAQFGDFANGAQIVIDNFIVAAEEKWGQTSGLVMLLPHGYEGQGAEHSSARLERYLSAAALGNITVAQPTTAAQYFHLLRAQARQTFRRPLIVMTPKSLLRSRVARSSIDELVGSSWSEVLDDLRSSTLDRAGVRRIVCCSGKIAFEATERRDAILANGAPAPTAILRVEQLYPWPQSQLDAVIASYPNATEVVWLQDEPANMGAWSFVYERLVDEFGDHLDIRRVSRAAAGSPATGSHLVHELEVEYLLDASIGSLRQTTA
jgi:2-oxoglutarate dehydrogenase E1 component